MIIIIAVVALWVAFECGDHVGFKRGIYIARIWEKMYHSTNKQLIYETATDERRQVLDEISTLERMMGEG